MAAENGFLLLTRAQPGQPFSMTAVSVDGALEWEKVLPCDGVFYRGNMSRLSCVDHSQRTLRGVNTRNGTVAWEKRFRQKITHVSPQGDELVVELDEKVAHRFDLEDGRLIRKETPIPRAARTFIEHVGDYLISATTIPHIFKTNLLWTRAYEDKRHIRTDGGGGDPDFKVIPQGLFFFGRHHETQTDIARVDPAHHRILWSAPWPFEHVPTNYLLEAHQNVVTWADGSHWASYSLVDGKIVGTGRRQRLDRVVVVHGNSATLQKSEASRYKLVIRPLQIMAEDQTLAQRKPFTSSPRWFSPEHEMTFMVIQHAGLDLDNGSYDRTDILRFDLRAELRRGDLVVDWKLRQDGKEPQGAFRVEKSAYLNGNSMFTDLAKLPAQPRFEGRSALILPQRVFREAVANGEARWNDLHGGNEKLEYLGKTWHRVLWERGEQGVLQVMPADLFRSGDVEYRVVESDGLPILVSASRGDWQVRLVTVKTSTAPQHEAAPQAQKRKERGRRRRHPRR